MSVESATGRNSIQRTDVKGSVIKKKKRNISGIKSDESLIKIGKQQDYLWETNYKLKTLINDYKNENWKMKTKIGNYEVINNFKKKHS